MDRLALLLILVFSGCSTLMSAGAAGAGAAIGSLAGPGGAAIGAAGGVVAMDLIEEESPVKVVGTGPAAVVHETKSLIETVGLWYLAIFVLLPFLTKRGRGWVKNFTRLHDAVSQQEMEKRDKLKEDRFSEIESKLFELKKQADSTN